MSNNDKSRIHDLDKEIEGKNENASPRRLCGNKVCRTTRALIWRQTVYQGKRQWLCNRCFLCYSKGRYCPFCRQIYRQTDGDGFDQKEWLECVGCLRWAHVACCLRSLGTEVKVVPNLLNSTETQRVKTYICGVCESALRGSDKPHQESKTQSASAKTHSDDSETQSDTVSDVSRPTTSSSENWVSTTTISPKTPKRALVKNEQSTGHNPYSLRRPADIKIPEESSQDLQPFSPSSPSFSLFNLHLSTLGDINQIRKNDQSGTSDQLISNYCPEIPMPHPLHTIQEQTTHTGPVLPTPPTPGFTDIQFKNVTSPTINTPSLFTEDATRINLGIQTTEPTPLQKVPASLPHHPSQTSRPPHPTQRPPSSPNHPQLFQQANVQNIGKVLTKQQQKGKGGGNRRSKTSKRPNMPTPHLKSKGRKGGTGGKGRKKGEVKSSGRNRTHADGRSNKHKQQYDARFPSSFTRINALDVEGTSLAGEGSLPAHLRATTQVYCGKLRLEASMARWIKCHKCTKWRRLLPLDPFESLSPKWICSYSRDHLRQNCSVHQEPMGKNQALLNLGHVRVYMERERILFLNDLFRTLHSLCIGKSRIPVVAGKELDLYRLYREITFVGGFECANKMDGTWGKVFRRLENYSNKVTDASYRLKRIYTQYLLPYENLNLNNGIVPPYTAAIANGTKAATTSAMATSGPYALPTQQASQMMQAASMQNMQNMQRMGIANQFQQHIQMHQQRQFHQQQIHTQMQMQRPQVGQNHANKHQTKNNGKFPLMSQHVQTQQQQIRAHMLFVQQQMAHQQAFAVSSQEQGAQSRLVKQQAGQNQPHKEFAASTKEAEGTSGIELASAPSQARTTVDDGMDLLGALTDHIPESMRTT